MIQAVIFDLDGVLVTTDDSHYEAWKRMADEEGICFNRQINQRLRGVSRMESLEIILERANKSYTEDEKNALAARKNSYYVALIQHLTPSALLPGALETVNALRKQGIKIAIGSSSKNAPTILRQVGIADLFDAVADGNQIKHSKPAPDVFLLAAELLRIPPANCLVVEDADAGVESGLNAGMKVLAVGAASYNQKAHLRADALTDIDLMAWIRTQA
ncbi:MAG: beta-phosphoglucomutase [Clostridiales bacterium]|nr:beta-phosphoglucomutase [Clostridiales bacterium]